MSAVNMTRRDFARRCFWTCHPLTELCAIAYGYWDNGQHYRRGDFSLAQLITFTEALPTDVYTRLVRPESAMAA